ncbi:MAG: HlyD family efflux transporter periplasmic adaptor subunit [Acidobacteria bacterium]|nr:MAG: HlyD family efflux transporter periplasmic adaptor subunit [Acidobacteriota bacterium]
MDIQRVGAARKRRIRMALMAGGGLLLIGLATLGLSKLKPAPPSVDASTLWPGTVMRGDMDVQVRGLGTLVPVQIQWIPAVTDGRVERRFLLPGVKVTPDTPLLQLSNPQLQQEAQNAEWTMKADQANLESLKSTLNNQLLSEQSTLAGLESDHQQANAQADVDANLASKGIVSDLTAQLSKAKATGLASQVAIEKKRVDTLAASLESQLSAQKAKVEQDRALYLLKKKQLDDLMVRAGYSGILTDIPVEVGQQVAAGATLAKVVDPTQLKAQLQIAETQAKDIQLNQKASVDTHNGIIPGRVVRIDPAVVNGTVTVDVALDGKLPDGARPDLSVDGTIEISHLTDVLYVGRPAFGQANSTVGLFKELPGTNEAERVQVKLGEASVNEVQILQGLNVGDKVILSDMSRWDGFDRVRLQ